MIHPPRPFKIQALTMRTYIKQLLTQDYASIRDIFSETFLKEEIPISSLGYRWRNRSHENSFGIFSSAGDLLGFALMCDGGHVQYQKQKKHLQNTEKTNDTLSRYLSFLAVHPAYRGSSLGSDLLMFLLQNSVKNKKSICLYPLDNTRLKHWYIRNGFYITSKDYFNFHSHYTRRQALFLNSIMNTE